MRLMIYLAITAMLLFVAPSARAQERLIIDDSEEAVITGFVEDVYYNTFTIRDPGLQEGPPITVSLNDIDLDTYNNLDTLIEEGMRVTVFGDLIDGNTIEAERIVAAD